MTPYWAETSVASIDKQCRAVVADKQANLTYPRGALGVLGRLSSLFAGWQGVTTPHCKKVVHRNFCSPKKLDVKNKQGESWENFVSESHLKPASGAPLAPLSELQPTAGYGMLGLSTSCKQPATTVVRAVQSGENVDDSILTGRHELSNEAADLLVANSLEESDQTIALDGLRKQQSFVLDKPSSPHEATQLLREWGSPTISAMTGAYIRAAQLGIPILVNGTVATAAALAAIIFNKGVGDWLIFSHTSGDFFHQEFISAVGADTVLQSAGPGFDNDHAKLAIDVIISTLAIHARMMNSGQASNDVMQKRHQFG